MKYSTLLSLAIPLLLTTSCSKDDSAYDATGIFESQEITVAAEVSGRILSLTIHEGEILRRGDVIGIIDTIPLHLRKQQILSTHDALLLRHNDVATQMASLREQIATQKKEKERFRTLTQANAAPMKTLDDIEAQIKILEKEFYARQQQLDKGNAGLSAEAQGLLLQIEQINYDIARSVIKAPQDGTVLNKYTAEGEYTMPSKPILKMADTEQLYLRAYVTAEQFNELKIGQQVIVAVDKADGDYREYKGKVTWISATAEFTPKTIQTKDERQNLVYAVKILVPNDGYIKIGMYGQVRL